jgi:hypothetical protein
MVNTEELGGQDILQQYNDLIGGLAAKSFEVDEKAGTDEIQLARDFLLHCLVAGYDSSQLGSLQERLKTKRSRLTLEIIQTALGKVDQKKYQKELSGVSESLRTIDFSKPQKPFGFALNLGLLDSQSDMYKLWQAITSLMPSDYQSVLAAQSF